MKSIFRIGKKRTEGKEQMKSAVVFLTWRCGNNCPYCWERQRQKHGDFTPEPLRDGLDWLEALNRIGFDVVDFSGGEPFMIPHFGELCRDVSGRIGITTNGKHNFTDWIQICQPQKVCCMTLSYHPTEDDLMVFTGKLLFLLMRGYPVQVNFVAYPEQLWLTEYLKNWFGNLQIKFHVDPYAATEFRPYVYNKVERDYLAKYVQSDRVLDRIEPNDCLCTGGMDHLNIQPNGDAYRCIADKIAGKPMIGNIFDKDFKLNTDYTTCNQRQNCPGCDRDKVKVKYA
jgi:MoaA/NifB/PqqE/SkfB family radical SAM enzyme